MKDKAGNEPNREQEQRFVNQAHYPPPKSKSCIFHNKFNVGLENRRAFILGYVIELCGKIQSNVLTSWNTTFLSISYCIAKSLKVYEIKKFHTIR